MLDSLWTRVLATMEGTIPETAIDSWLRPCRCHRDGGRSHPGRRRRTSTAATGWCSTTPTALQGAARDRPRRQSARDHRHRSTRGRRPTRRRRARGPPPCALLQGPQPALHVRHRSSSASRTSSPRPPARRSPSCRPRPTTRSSSTAGSASARRTCCTRSATRRSGYPGASASSTSRPSGSRTS